MGSCSQQHCAGVFALQQAVPLLWRSLANGGSLSVRSPWNFFYSQYSIRVNGVHVGSYILKAIGIFSSRNSLSQIPMIKPAN